MNLPEARSIIILSPDGDDPDADVIKTMLAITNDPTAGAEPYHIVAEIRDPQNLEVAGMVGGDEVELVLVGDLIARITAQTCRQSGLSVVYTELLDFRRRRDLLPAEPALVGKTFGEALFAVSKTRADRPAPGGQAPRVNPPMDTRIGAGGPADRDRRGRRHRDAVAAQRLAVNECGRFATSHAAGGPERTLILGWNWRARPSSASWTTTSRPAQTLTVVADDADGQRWHRSTAAPT